MKAQAAFFDCNTGPDLREQIILADDFVRSGQQRHEDVIGPRCELYGDSIPGELFLACGQFKGTERDCFCGLRWRRHLRVVLISALKCLIF
jgi:hypothetical protein